MSIMDSSSSSIMGDNNSVLQINDDVVWQIALRLPTKSLMRFKSVSKQWNAMIRDPLFVKSHIGGFRGLLAANSTESCFREKQWHTWVGVGSKSIPTVNCFLNSNVQRKRNSNIPGCYQLWLDDKYMHYRDYVVTNIEKGLCVFYNYGNPEAFTLCNIATHELLDLPIKPPEEEAPYGRMCYLGFEPVRGVYKLLRFSVSDNYEDRASLQHQLQICTLGGGEEDKGLDWRNIDNVIQLGLPRLDRNICVNGILYLTASPATNSDPDNLLLGAFDLGTEIAPQFIPLPDGFTSVGELILVGGSPGLIHFSHGLSTIWILKDNNTWTKNYIADLMEICHFDFTFLEVVGFSGICGLYISYVGTLPTGEVLLAPTGVSRDNRILPIYKYDHLRNKISKWTELSIPFCGWDTQFGWMCYLEDNIVPLDSLITRCNTSGSCYS